jgi:acetoin utilization deacetylase AcuC-like enzyme
MSVAGDGGPVVGWMDSPVFDRHETYVGHPESPARLTAIRARLDQTGLSRRLHSATPNPIDRGLLERVHSRDYIARIEALSAAGGGQLDEDTAVGRDTLQAARLASGAVADAVDRVLRGTWTRAFCSVRPPGHHASRNRGMGFCIFNNVAIGAAAALERPAVQRVAVLDWDAHHGNGTQDIFGRDERVFYGSWHQFPFYPYTGAPSENSTGPGRGTVVNCPMPAGSGDRELAAAWSEQIEPALTTFHADVLFISAGFDADRRDPLTTLNVTTAGFRDLSTSVVAWADRYCNGRIVSVLEGGYHLVALAEDVEAHVRALLHMEEGRDDLAGTI